MARHLITSAIPYINGIKHLGNLVGSQLPADLYARYLRGRGHEVLFLCATDEHGTPAELAAAKAGQPVADYCAEMHQVQAGIARGFRLSFDHFGRSSSAQNRILTQHFAVQLAKAGLIREVSEQQMYSVADGRFLPDRYIEGTCPNCGFTSARGDQCDNCTKQLDPVDLINPRSVISGSTELELRDTKHLYLRQSSMRQALSDWIDTKTDWPVLTTSIARSGSTMATGCRTAASPATCTGACRRNSTGRPGRAWTARCSMSGSMRPSNTSPAPGNDRRARPA
jgi:methionyl-tRNA synthetase